ncbi:NAD(P)H-dependent oxidoreductase [Sinomicrobium soli]|uniref:NAD(P)H-dependent oxidoreductase n=1 Tax=Sinomicrobium sp. N-1-3-6 TaxID=2219864 RepID=UPI000DCEB769|nr:NAD(P)H-dependent oxidoreductase [Sinomicrobium sp. N-1-3-6]RAV28756.1 NAD(P)H-dependent oxidoreductase [Sinomicrobium sp. N-1-3-6]
MSLIENLNWRYATKAYDPTKRVSEEDLYKILEAARLAPTSSGLQQYRVLAISNQEMKERLKEGSLNPESMMDCSHVLVFAAWDNYTDERIDTIYDYTTRQRGLPDGQFKSYTDKIKAIFASQTIEQNFDNAARQCYIGLAMALAQAAELKIDSTPAEGFDNAQVDKTLELKVKGLKSVVLMYVGYRAEHDWLAPMRKVRNPMDEFVTFIE